MILASRRFSRARQAGDISCARGRKFHPIPKPLTPSRSPEGEGGPQAG
jgi:hypothetical protein